MSEQDNNTPDPNKNLKEEFNRKLGNTESQLAQLKQANEALVAQMNAITSRSQAKPVEEDDLDTLFITNPKRAAAIIEERTEAKVMGKLNSMSAAQQKQQSVVGGLVSDYPELNDQSHSFTKKVNEIYSSLSDDEKQSGPMAYKLAVAEAARETGMKPKSKRSDEDDYSLSSSSNSRGSEKRSKKGQLDPTTAAWAEILGEAAGVDLTTPEAKERIAKRQDRNWSKYRPIKEGKK